MKPEKNGNNEKITNYYLFGIFSYSRFKLSEKAKIPNKIRRNASFFKNDKICNDLSTQNEKRETGNDASEVKCYHVNGVIREEFLERQRIKETKINNQYIRYYRLLRKIDVNIFNT